MKQRIVVVDDDPANLKMASRILKGADYQGSYFKSGKEFLQYVQEGKELDLLLLDIHMPDMNGFDVLEKLRSQDPKFGIPVVFLSADETDYTREQARKAGVEDYLFKPLIPEQLLRCVSRILNS